ncbi:MAG: hypothetical protein ACKOXT_01115 [Actinomycetota bacterium]
MPAENSSIDFRSENGSAIVELIGFGILLQIPILFFAISALGIQQQAIAVESIARHGLRAFTLSTDISSVESVVAELVSDFQLDANKLSWLLHCNPDPKCQIGGIAKLEVNYGNVMASAAARF